MCIPFSAGIQTSSAHSYPPPETGRTSLILCSQHKNPRLRDRKVTKVTSDRTGLELRSSTPSPTRGYAEESTVKPEVSLHSSTCGLRDKQCFVPIQTIQLQKQLTQSKQNTKCYGPCLWQLKSGSKNT